MVSAITLVGTFSLLERSKMLISESAISRPIPSPLMSVTVRFFMFCGNDEEDDAKE